MECVMFHATEVVRGPVRPLSGRFADGLRELPENRDSRDLRRRGGSLWRPRMNGYISNGVDERNVVNETRGPGRGRHTIERSWRQGWGLAGTAIARSEGWCLGRLPQPAEAAFFFALRLVAPVVSRRSLSTTSLAATTMSVTFSSPVPLTRGCSCGPAYVSRARGGDADEDVRCGTDRSVEELVDALHDALDVASPAGGTRC